MLSTDAVPSTTPADMAKRRAWAEQCFVSATTLPLAFVFDQKPITSIPAEWQPVSQRRCIDANLTETVFEGTDPATGLHIRVEYLEYHDYPVIEWVVWLTNKGPTITPILRDILALDGIMRGAAPVLTHCNGDFYSEEGYTSRETALSAGDTLSFAPNGGRPCDGAFPYYRLVFEEGGLSIAIGWPAQWAARFSPLADGVQIRTGDPSARC